MTKQITMNEYQAAALTTAVLGRREDFYHLVLGLTGESGEIAEKAKKLIRDHDGNLEMLDKDDLIKEIGDVMWYAAVLADFLGYDFNEVADKNMKKLADRKARNMISGSGDNR